MFGILLFGLYVEHFERSRVLLMSALFIIKNICQTVKQTLIYFQHIR